MDTRNNGWISIEDKLPDFNIEILVYSEICGQIVILPSDMKRLESLKVTWWRPLLPDPPMHNS